MFISKKILIIAFAVIVFSTITVLVLPEKGRSQTRVVAVVKLYSGGEVVGKWDAISIGKVEGDTYVFTTAHGVKEPQIRIRGAYSVETIPQ